MKTVRLQLAIFLCGVATLAAWAAPALAQQQSSLGDAARRAREQKKHAPKAARVWTNDNLPDSGGVSVVGPPTEPAAPTRAEGQAESSAGAAEGEEKDAQETEARLREAKEQLKRAEKQLDLVQRDFDLQRQQYYSNPGYTSDTAGKEKLDALRGQIAAKQNEVQKAKEKVVALEKELENLKRRPSPSKPETPPAEK
jgi:uncharacterized coiled-coil protein SlyX